MRAARASVLICGDTDQSAHLAEWQVDPHVDLQVAGGLCRRPGMIRPLLAGREVERLALGLCPDEYSLAEVQTEARKVGLDALGLEIVHLRSLGLEKAKRTLRAAVARARAFRGSGPENAKLRLSGRVSRRALLKLSFSEYVAAPSIERASCAAGTGCRACVDVCPQDALEWSRGKVRYDKSKCEPCGLCLTACPTGAVSNPAFTPSQIETQMRTLLDETQGPCGIAFHCQYGGEPPTADGWMAVRLPCVGMATPPWLLTPLLMGASAVGVVSCPAECPANQVEASRENVDFCRQLLRRLGAPEELVALDPDLARDPPERQQGAPLEGPFSHQSGAAPLEGLASRWGVERVTLEHARSPLGLIEIGEACTACGMCADSCPTGALALEVRPESCTLTFDAGACVTCGQCLPKCPELAQGAITLRRKLDVERLKRGRNPLYRVGIARCTSCGALIASSKMVERVGELLGEEHASVMPILARYCPECRVTSQVA